MALFKKNTSPEPKAGILDIAPYVAGKSKAGAKVDNVIKLSSNETPLGPSPRAMAAYVLQTGKLYRYPDSSHAALHEAIGDVYKLPAQQIICGAGSDELIGLLVHAYAGAGDEVIYTEYGFLMYKIYTQMNGATPVVAGETNLHTDVDKILAKVTKKTKIVFVANPNNPTGSYISATEMKRLRDGLPGHVILAIDGAYTEYVDAPDYSSGEELVKAADNTVMLRTFSKIYGLSALRLGWCFAPPGIIEVLNRVRSPFNVSSAAIVAGAEAVRDLEHVQTARLHNNHWREWLVKEFAALGLVVAPSVANFLLVRFPGKNNTASAANSFLLERGIIVREMGGYGLPDCLRITVGLKEENEALTEALKLFMAS